MTSVEIQAELALSRAPLQAEVPIEMVRAKKSASAAFTLACDASGLEDKEIFLAMEPAIDAGYFSRMKKGTATLDADRIEEFCRVVGNTIYPEWIASQIGCGLYVLKTVAERRAEEAEARAVEAEKKLAWAMEVIKGVKP